MSSRSTTPLTIHRGEYGYADRKTGTKFNTNTIEGYYSIFKRGMKGVYQHFSEQHLHRYLAEFDFRYSTVPRLASRIWSAPRRLAASSESASPIGGLTASHCPISANGNYRNERTAEIPEFAIIISV